MSHELHGVAVYNPDLLAKHELVQLFVARRPLLERLVRDLHDETEGVPQHHLIVGRRGMGKTTLLRRLRHAIEDDPALDAHWIALVFPEEQYNVATLSDFWLNCVDALADALESRGRRDVLAEIDEQVAEIATLADEGERRERALSLLLRLADGMARRLVLLVDNLDQIFARLDQDDWALRELLSREGRLLLIGASTQALESSFRYDRAFYDFFRIHELEGLDEAQTFEVMRHLAQITKQTRVLDVIEHEPGRIQALRLLSGGNPRTLVLLFNLLAQGSEGDARSDLERLLDQVTPLYKHRFEELPAQAQRVVDGLALGWDPMTARDLADRLRLDINQTSAQLNRLVKQGVVEKTRLPGTARIGFLLSERFFNIWYLMRASRRMRRRLIFLVKFLELFFQKPALRAQAQRRLRATENPRDADYGFALAQVTDDLALRHALETHSIRAALTDPSTDLGAILDLDGEDRALKTRAERVEALQKAERAIMANQDWPDGIDGTQLWERLGGSLKLSARDKLKIATKLQELPIPKLMRLFEGFEDEHRQWAVRSSEAVATAVCDAVRRGYIDEDLSVDDIESVVALNEFQEVRPFLLALRSVRGMTVEREVFDSCIQETRSHWIRSQWAQWASHLDEDTRLATIRDADPGTMCIESLLGLADLLWTFSRPEESEIAVRQAIECNADSAPAWYMLGFYLNVLARYEEAEFACRRAIEIDPNYAQPWNGLANLLKEHLSRYDEAEAAYRRAIELDSNSAYPWDGLANLLYYHLSRYDEAEAAYRRAIELDPTFIRSWNELADLLCWRLSRYDEAEAAFRRVIELDSKSAKAWKGLADLLHYCLSRYDEAEAAYLRAIELRPNSADSWYDLARLLHYHFSRYGEAEEAYRHSIELEPDLACSWYDLATLLHYELSRQNEAETAYRRAIELDPGLAYAWYGLAKLLHYDLSCDDEAEAAYRRAIELNPDSTYSWYELANLLHHRLSRYDESEVAYRRAIEVGPDFAYSWYGLAGLLHRISRCEESEVAYRRAIELDSNSAYFWHGLANLLQYRLFRSDEAEAAYRRAATLAPDEPDILNSYAWKLYTDKHDLESAERIALEAFTRASDSIHYMHTLACIQAARGQWPFELARQFLTDEKSRQEFWADMMLFFSEVVHHGHASDARALVQSLPNADAWAPLIIALEVLEQGSPEQLRALSPEMRTAVELALSRIAPEFGSTS